VIFIVSQLFIICAKEVMFSVALVCC